MENIVDQEMVVLVAPDGTPQPATLAEDMAQCLAFLKLLHSKKMGQSPAQLMFKGFKVLPVKVSITVIGDENDAFNNLKKKTA